MKKEIFNPRIFRDITNVDYQKTPWSVIFRVVRYGDWQDFKNLKKVYNADTLAQFLEKRGEELDP